MTVAHRASTVCPVISRCWRLKVKTRTLLLGLGAAVVAALLWIGLEHRDLAPDRDHGNAAGESAKSDPPREMPTARSAAPTAGTAASAVGADDLAALYRATSYADVMRRYEAAGANPSFDLVNMKAWVTDLCSSWYAFGPRRTLVERAQRALPPGSEWPDAAQSARLGDRYLQAYCGDVVDDPSLRPTPMEGPEEYYQALDRLGLQALIDAHKMALENDFVQGSPERQANARAVTERLRDLAAKTESPAVFEAAAAELARKGWQPEGYVGDTSHIYGNGDHWTPGKVGVALAFCRLAGGGCGPNGLRVMLACLPANCRAGESLLDFYRRTVAPQSLQAAQRYADGLLAVRAGP